MISKAHNPVKIRYKDEEFGGELNLGAGLSTAGDPRFATADDAISWLVAHFEDGTLDRRNDYVIVPAWL